MTWLPFLLFGPTTLASVNAGGYDDGGLDRLAAVEEIVARFLASAEPFVARVGGVAELRR